MKKHKEVCHLIASKKKVGASASEPVNIPTVVRIQTKANVTLAEDNLNTLENSFDETTVASDSSDGLSDSSDETTVALAVADEISSLSQSTKKKCELCQVSSDAELSMDLKSQTLTPCLTCGKNINRSLRAKCPICGVALIMKSLENHYRIRHKDQKFVRCAEGCDQVFLSESAKNQHHSYHTLRCTCDETFKNIRAYKMHQRDCNSQRTSEVMQVNVPDANDEPPLKILRMDQGSKIFKCVPVKISFFKRDPMLLVRGTKSAEKLPESDPLQILENKTEIMKNKPIEVLNVIEKPTESKTLKESAEIDPLLTTEKVPSETFDLSSQAIEPSESVEAIKPVINQSKSVNGKKPKEVPNNDHNFKMNFEPSAEENQAIEPCSVCDSPQNIRKERKPSSGR